MKNSIWKVGHTQVTTASPEAIWARWSNVSDWPSEDINLVSARLEGDFVKGSKIIMRPKGSPKSIVVITEVTPNKSFSTVGNIPLGKLKIDHKIAVKNGETTFSHTITLTGPMRGVFAKLVAQKLADNLPNKMQNIATLAEQSK